MTGQQREFFKNLMAGRKKALLSQASKGIKSKDQFREDRPSDPLDIAGNTTALELMAALGNKERREIEELDYALKKIDGGSYGVCEACEEQIAQARLEAIPTARLCRDCKASQEQRPQENIVIRKPRRLAVEDADVQMFQDQEDEDKQ